MVGVKWTAASNLLVHTQAPSPNELVATLGNAFLVLLLMGHISDIIPNVRWSCVVLANVPTSKAPDLSAHNPDALHSELAMFNPEYYNLTIVRTTLSGPLCPSSSPATLYGWGVPS